MDDATIVQELKNGSKDAFKLLFERYHDLMVNYALQFLDCREDAKDVVQEVFVVFWEGRRFESINGASVRGYLIVSVKRRCLRVLSYARRRAESDCAALERELEQHHQVVQFWQSEVNYTSIITPLLDTLPTRASEVVDLLYLKELSGKQASYVLNISHHTVRTHAKRALKLLRQRMTNKNIYLFCIFCAILWE